jgi:hypothetical protein
MLQLRALVNQPPYAQSFDEIVRKTAWEGVAALVVVAVSGFFLAPPAWGAFLASQTCWLAVHFAVRLISAAASCSQWGETLCVFSFKANLATPLPALIHEMGHALGAVLLFRGAHPVIQLTRLGNGMTRYNFKTLSLLGAMIGRTQARLAVAAAGPATALTASGLALFAAHRGEKRDLRWAPYAQAIATDSVISHALYALRALDPAAVEINDFRFLYDGGIHPLVSAIATVAWPLTIYWGLQAALEESPSPHHPSP